ncbi:MAG: thioredoxin-dependent thiol peroxidase [Bacteroidota bacterium]|nr:thioredoxin-dependent thiol peroxidase [Candidatus Kapabacteria bacterium]MDW8218955.1 thioredoxin-dependent thiol peroxidase [Bacteroidota bacterium]
MSSLLGQQAPKFIALTDNGETISLDNLRGQTVVLYFYPKDNTSGCIAEACDFRDNMQSIRAAGAIVIGISPDSPASHTTFKNKHQLNFALISDQQHDISMLYGVWVEKSLYGRKYMGIERSTFIINPEGIIIREWRKVKVAGHVQAVLQALLCLPKLNPE